MTKTLTDLLGILRFRGDMRNTVRFPDANLTTELQAAFAEGYQVIVGQNEGFFDTTGTVPTTAAVAFVALPADAWIVRAVDRVEGVTNVPMPRIGIKDRNKYGTTNGRPVAHHLTARGIDLFPTPDAVYSLIVSYTPVAPTLGSSPINYYNSWEEYAISGALVRLYNNQGRDSTIWQTALAQAAVVMMAGAAHRDASGPEYLNLREGWDGAENIDSWRTGF